MLDVNNMLGWQPKTPQRSCIHVAGGLADGSVGTKIRRFSTIIRNIGNAITYTRDPDLGDTFVINEPGIYTMSLSDLGSGSSNYTYFRGITKNSRELTISVESVDPLTRLVSGIMYNDATGNPSGIGMSTTEPLSPGDVIRVHHDAKGAGATLIDRLHFTITKVSE